MKCIYLQSVLLISEVASELSTGQMQTAGRTYGQTYISTCGRTNEQCVDYMLSIRKAYNSLSEPGFEPGTSGIKIVKYTILKSIDRTIPKADQGLLQFIAIILILFSHKKAKHNNTQCSFTYTEYLLNQIQQHT